MKGLKWKVRFTAAFILLIFLISTVHALESDEILIQSDKDWMTAGGDPASIEVIVNNVSVTVQSVEFSVLETGSSGTVTSSLDTVSPWRTDFYSEESGVADIYVTVNYIDSGYPYSISKTFQQKVDHASMYSLGTPDYQYEATVNDVVTITVCALDRYGNLVDSKKEEDLGGTPESFELRSSESSEFWDGSGFTTNVLEIPVNSSGKATALFRVSEIAGVNIVNIFWPPSGALLDTLAITSLANADPVIIAVNVNPASGDPPYQPADGISEFYITYQLLDQWGNPSGNRQLYINSTDPAEPAYYRTSNSTGKIAISYGPQAIKGIYSLVASSVDNMSLSVVTDLEFVSTAPTDMLLTANPQVMPSHDVASDKTSAIRAKVIDEKGNPVMGENVVFSIIHGSYPDYQVAEPYLVSYSAVSDQNGQAIVSFVPGSFETDVDSLNFSDTASATCRVQAEWNTTVRNIDLEWKNYPYLSVSTNVTPETVAVNDTVEVTITLVGDGWALQPDPIDVMLTADRSGSMLMDYPDRMVSLMDALKVFADDMNEGRDRLGLVSFGVWGIADIYDYGDSREWAGNDDKWSDDSSYISAHYTSNGKYYNDHATIDIPLTLDLSDFDDEVNGLVPYSGTPMRKGLYYAIKHVRDNARENAVKAVVVLSDGDYTWYGDPLASGTGDLTKYDWGNKMQDDYTIFSDLSTSEQDMRVFANNNNIKIFSIAFADGISQDAKAVLQTLAEDTGGKYYYAPEGDDLADIYKDIAGELKTAAGVDTKMDLMFQNIEINNVTVPNTGSDAVLEYIYDPEGSTLIENFYDNGSYTSEIRDQRAWWAENKSLQFDVGTVYLNQTWQTTFLLKVLKPGNINLFNDTSFISFNGGEDILKLPDTWFTAVADLNSTGVDFASLDVSDLKKTDQDTNKIYLEWTLEYTGSFTAIQELSYRRDGDSLWTSFNTLEQEGAVGPETRQSEFGTSGLLPGIYTIRLVASAPDTADDMEILEEPVNVGTSAGAYIKIE